MARIDEALRLYPKDAEALALRGNNFRLMKKNDEALNEYDKAIALDPQCGFGFDKSRRHTDRTRRRIIAASRGPRRSSKTWPGKRGWFTEPRIWQRRKEFEKAIGDLEQTLRQDPENVMALSSLSWNLATCPTDNIRDGRKALVYARKAYAHWLGIWGTGSTGGRTVITVNLVKPFAVKSEALSLRYLSPIRRAGSHPLALV